MTEFEKHEQQALLTVAADIEVRQQNARRAHHLELEQRLAAESKRLWARWAALERAA